MEERLFVDKKGTLITTPHFREILTLAAKRFIPKIRPIYPRKASSQVKVKNVGSGRSQDPAHPVKSHTPSSVSSQDLHDRRVAIPGQLACLPRSQCPVRALIANCCNPKTVDHWISFYPLRAILSSVV